MDEGFTKLNLQSLNVGEAAKNRQSTRFKLLPKRKGLTFSGTLLLVVGIIFFAIFIPARKTYVLTKQTMAQAKQAVADIKNQDIQKTGDDLAKTKEALNLTQKSLNTLAWTKFIPFFGGYWNDASHALRAGNYGLEAAQIAVEAVEPYADVLGLKGQGSFVLGSAEQRIQTAVQTMDKITPKIGEINQKMAQARKDVDQINAGHYPQLLFGRKLRYQIENTKATFDQYQQVLSDAQPLLEVLPKLLGEPESKRYLLIFQNDKELRPTGGFITAYAILRMEHGKMIVDSSDDIYRLDSRRTKRVAPPEPIVKYLPAEGGRVATEWNMRDSNLSPDFAVSMAEFKKFYDQIPGAAKIDGIIAIDTQTLLRIIDILGGVDAYGTQFTTKNDPRCNCPQVIYELEYYAGQPRGYVTSERKDIIGVLMHSIMQKALGTSPKLYWGKLFQESLNLINEKHILVYLFNDQAQKGAEAFNMAGRIKDVNGGDYLHINDTNFAGAKANMYVKHQVEQKIEVAADGQVTETLVLNYKNPQPPDDCSLERKGGLCLSATLRNWVRIYVPKGVQLVESKGSEVDVATKEDLGKTVFEGFLTVRPQGSAQLTLKYKLPFKIEKGKEYRLLLQKQPGTEGHEYIIMVAGKKVEEFPLKTDKELKLKI